MFKLTNSQNTFYHLAIQQIEIILQFIEIPYFLVHNILYINRVQITPNNIIFENNDDPDDDFKTVREQYAVHINHERRQDKFSKRRNYNTPIEGTNIMMQQKRGSKLMIVDPRYYNEIQGFVKQNYSSENFNELVSMTYDQDILKQHQGVIGIRKIVSTQDNPPIQDVIDAGLVPKFIEYMKQTKYPQLQLQATWALTNVASGTTIQTQTIIDKGGIPLFIQLLSENKPGIAEQAIWAIGNISGDCTFYRDAIIRAGGVQPLLRIIQNSTDKNIVKQGAWALSNLCRGSPLPKYQLVKNSIPTLCKLLKNGLIQDKQVVADCCWAISYMSQGQKSKIQRVVETGVVPAIVQLTKSPFQNLIIPSVRILGNIVTGNQLQTQQVLKAGVLDSLQVLLQNHKKTVRRQTCWVISNIAAGTSSQVNQLLAHRQLIQKILKLFETDATQVRKQICWTFNNMSHLGEPSTIFQLYKEVNIIRYYVNILNNEDHKIVQASLDCLYNILAIGEKNKFSDKNPLVIDLFNTGGVDIIQKLQYHQSEAVYNKVIKILTRYFEIQDPLDI